MRRISRIKAALLAAAAILSAAAWAAADDLQTLQTRLISPASTAVQREEAARKLIENTSSDALEILRTGLQATDNQPAELAVAHALAGQDSNPDPSFIPLLDNKLGSNPLLTDAAAQALANYRNNPEIFPKLNQALSNFSLPDPSRVAIVKAMGNVLEQRAAASLIQALQDPANSDSVHKAAAEALGEMTGLQDYGPDLQRWQLWWQANQNKTPDQWRADLLASRAREETRLKQHYGQLLSDARQRVRQLYSLTPADQKEAMLINYLAADPNSPENRVAGAQLVTDDFEDNRPISPAVKQHLRQLIGDSDRDVRDAVIEALGNINDQEAAPDLIAQLSHETDSQIRVKIASALGRMNNLTAVPALLDMLDSRYFREASAAADALARLGEQLRTTNPALAQQATEKLQKILDTRSTDPAAGDLRANCVRALAEMGDARSLNTFIHLLRPDESDAVHIAALRGLEVLKSPDGVATITDALKDPKPEVQLAAAHALENVGGFAQADQLYGMLVPETNPPVRDAVWADLQKIFKTGSVEDLTPWPDRFKNDPEKRLAALRALRDALLAANKNQDAALEEQNVGEALMNLTPKRAAEAVDSFQKAINYWSKEGKNQPGVDAALDGLVGDMLDALLYLKKYPEAADFSAAQMKISSAYVPTVGAKLKIEAQQLEKAGDNDDAKNLINAALKIPWPPESHYQIDLKQTLDEINSRAANPTPGNP